MKIIALISVKNEAWILPTYLSSINKVADKIIALDDDSTDNSREILEKAQAVVIPFSHPGKEVNMSLRRKRLLQEGRRAGGSHFIWLDADEAFSFSFNQNGREIISLLRPGEKLAMRWITLWKSTLVYRTDKPWGLIYKDFIVCDSPEQNFSDQFLSEPRTPGDNHLIKKLPESEGVVLHFQFAAWQRAELKQAYYRMRELIEGKRNARRINATYSATFDSPKIQTDSSPPEWFKNLIMPEDLGQESSKWYLDQIFDWFNKYQVEFFEPLEIWHVEKLHQEFIRRRAREPKTKTYPAILIALNNLKNWLKN